MRRPVLLLSLLFTAPLLFFQLILSFIDSVFVRIFMPQELFYFIDSTSNLSFELISSGKFSNQFTQHASYQNKDFRTNASYWIKFPIRHKAATKKVWLLEFYDQSIDQIDAYIPQEDGSYRMLSMGDSRPFLQRPFRHKNFEVPLSMKSDAVKYYYF